MRMNVEMNYKPLIMNATIFNTLCKCVRGLTPRFRCAILQFDVWKIGEIVNGIFVHELDKMPPEWVIILNLQFLNINKHVFLGTITYFDNSNKFVIANGIKSFIDDLHVSGLRILASVSSGHPQILEILQQLQVKKDDKGFLSYRVGRYGPLVHLFDPSWLLRQLQKKFLTNNITFEWEGLKMVAKYEHISKTSKARKLLSSPKEYEMFCAIKMFSCTMGCILHSVSDEHNCIWHTAKFVHMINRLFDTFNSCDDENVSNPIRKDGPTKIHFAIWKDTIEAMESMEFEPVRIIESRWIHVKDVDRPVILLDPKNDHVQRLHNKVGRIMKSINSNSFHASNLIEELQYEMETLRSAQLDYGDVIKLENGKYVVKSDIVAKVEDVQKKLNKNMNKKGQYRNNKPYSKPVVLDVIEDIDEADNEINFRDEPFIKDEINKESKTGDEVNDALYCDAEDDITINVDVMLKADHNDQIKASEKAYQSIIFDMRKKLTAINDDLNRFKSDKLVTDRLWKIIGLVSNEVETCDRMTDKSLMEEYYKVLKANNDILLEIIIVVQVCVVANSLEPRTQNTILQKFFIIMQKFNELRALTAISPSNRIDVNALTQFQMWTLSIGGMIEVVTMSRKHKVGHIYTKYFNCDTLHDKVTELQTINGSVVQKVVERSYSKILENSLAILPFSNECNFTVR